MVYQLAQKDKDVTIESAKNNLMININKLTQQEVNNFVLQMTYFINKSNETPDGKLGEGEISKDFVGFLIRLFY